MASLLLLERCAGPFRLATHYSANGRCSRTIATGATRLYPSWKKGIIGNVSRRRGVCFPASGGRCVHNHPRRWWTVAKTKGQPRRTRRGDPIDAKAYRPFCAFPLDDHLWRYHFSNYDSKETQSSSSKATLLATSGSAFSVESDEGERFLRRLVRWMRETLLALWEALLVSVRATQVVVRLSPLTIAAPASVLWDRFVVGDEKGKTNALSDWSWWYFTTSMQALGPAFVKLCQWIATRRDLFPPHVCDRLSKLHDRGTPHSWQYTRRALREAFGDDYEDRGLHIEEGDVIGCGSAAQVYRGTLLVEDDDDEEETAADGEIKRRHRRRRLPVAVKVLHPRFHEMVERDLWFLQSAADLMHSVIAVDRFRMLNLPRATETFATVLRRQSDLRIEADNLKRFRENFYGCIDHGDRQEEEGSRGSSYSIVFPRPVDEWTTTNVLVEDLVHDAVPIAEYLRDDTEEGIETCKELAAPLLRAFLKMVFLDNFVHGDLHPGNVLIRTLPPVVPEGEVPFWDRWGVKTKAAPFADRCRESRRSIVFLDAGIATSLCPNEQRNLRDLFRAVILNEGETAGRLMVERAKYERCSQTPGGVDAFAAGIGELVAEFHDRRREGLTLGAVRIGSLLCRVLDLCRIHGVEIDPAMASIVISTLVLEGLGRSLEPNLNLIDFAVPFVIGRGRFS